MARAATSPELVLYRTPGKRSILRAAIIQPPIVFRARINQTFSTYDQVLSIVYDGGTGTLGDVLTDMEIWIGSSLDARDKGICRLRDKDATHFYLSETSEIAFADDDYVTIVAGFGIYARPVRISGGVTYIDEIAYNDQHTNWDPQPNMGANQALDLTGLASVSATFGASSSFCPGSSIASYAWSCATASASSGTTTATPTFTFDTGGTHVVYLTVTAANGKTFLGVRYVFVRDETHPTFEARISNPGHCDVDSGGWEIELTLFGNVNLNDIYDRAMVILFSEDYYGETKQAIGPVAGSENVWFVGWIGGENNHIKAEQGSVTFTANGAAFWMKKIPSWPAGVEITSGTPDWTSIQNLTVDLGVYHFLRHRSTITRVVDITLTGDTRISQEVSSSAQDLWSQLQEMTWAQIYARPGVNALNQLSIQIHPSLIPLADRAYPTVMAITTADYADGLDFDRQIVDDVGIVDLSGVQVTAPNTGSSWFALAPGHSLPHYGGWDIQSNLLLASQAQAITLASLYRSLKNNPFPDIPIIFDAPIRLIDCFPNQKCTINISSADNIRGWAYSGGLIPTAMQLVQDPKTGYCHIEVNFEAETTETDSQATVGDTPGSGDSSQPPSIPAFPSLPTPPIIFPSETIPDAGTQIVVIWDSVKGFIYCENFDDSNPTYALMNGGLTDYTTINFMVVCPNGALYSGYSTYSGGAGPRIIRVASVGGTWSLLYDYTSGHALYPEDSSLGIGRVGVDMSVPERVAFLMGNNINANLWVGANGSYASQAIILVGNIGGDVSFGGNRWRVYGRRVSDNNKHYWLVSTDGGTITNEGAPPSDAGEQDAVYHAGNVPVMFASKIADVGLYRWENNFLDTPTYLSEDVDGGQGMAIDFTGQLLVARWSTGSKGISVDGGYSYSALSNLPPGSWNFAYAGNPGVDWTTSRWIAISGTQIKYSADGGQTWIDKLGNMLSVNPSPHIGMVKAVSPYGG